MEDIKGRLDYANDFSHDCELSYIERLEKDMSAYYPANAYEFYITHHRRGVIYYTAQDYQKAADEFTKAYDILHNLGKDDMASEVEIKIGYSYFNLGIWDKAAEHFESVKALWEPVYGEGNDLLLSLYDYLSVSYFSYGNYGAALPIFKKELPLIKKLYGDTSLPVAQLYYNIGTASYQCKNEDDAIEAYEAACAVFEACDAKSGQFWESSCSMLIALYFSKAKSMSASSEQASGLLEKSLAVLGKMSGETAITKARIYTNIGALYWNNADYDNAIEFLEKAIVFYKDALGEDGYDSSTYVAYNNLGLAYSEKNRFDDAITCLKKALELHTKLFGNSDLSTTATIYSNIGKFLSDKGDYQHAVEYMQKALATQERLSGENNLDVARMQLNIGSACLFLAEYDRAMIFFQKALPLFIDSSNREYEAMCYNGMGVAQSENGNFTMALNYFQKAQVSWESLPVKKPAYADVYMNMGNLYLKKG
ncbi:MAG: tetratricopeptide repeat protein, partial [Treponema sp.]|nr:tetratricopeptide repeat protein [Treponema sp.]